MPALAVEAAAEDVRRDLVGGLSMVNARTGGGVSALLTYSRSEQAEQRLCLFAFLAALSGAPGGARYGCAELQTPQEARTT